MVFATISQPQKTLGKYVWAANNDHYTIGEIFAEVAKTAGMKGAKCMQVTPQTFEDLYGKMGWELAAVFKLWEKYGGNQGAREMALPEKVILPEELGVKLRSLKEYLKEQDLSVYL